jgi:hypothetical protein
MTCKNKTTTGNHRTSQRTRSSTFAIPAKAHRRPKIAKELVLFAPHRAITQFLATFFKRVYMKPTIQPAINSMLQLGYFKRVLIHLPR